MSKPPTILYAPVNGGSHENVTLEESPLRTKATPKVNWISRLLLIEGLHLILFLGGFALYLLAQYRSQTNDRTPRYHGLDTYFALNEYNTIKHFYGEADLMNKTTESDLLFERIQSTDGIVAINTEWALEKNYAPSHVHPSDPTKSIYQIDMFHSLHCRFRIRNMLLSDPKLEDTRRDNHHTLHCLDYIREQLMCSPDLLLQGTKDLVHFDVNNGHTCRNSDVITDWAKSHHWAGHRQWLIDNLGIE